MDLTPTHLNGSRACFTSQPEVPYLSLSSGLNMAKTANTSGSAQVRITLSSESARLLDELAAKGIYGRNRAEVAARFVDQALQEFVEKPTLKLASKRSPKR